MNSRSLAGVSQMCLRGEGRKRGRKYGVVEGGSGVVKEWCSEGVV